MTKKSQIQKFREAARELECAVFRFGAEMMSDIAQREEHQ
jgi:hypothetical protein